MVPAWIGFTTFPMRLAYGISCAETNISDTINSPSVVFIAFESPRQTYLDFDFEQIRTENALQGNYVLLPAFFLLFFCVLCLKVYRDVLSISIKSKLRKLDKLGRGYSSLLHRIRRDSLTSHRDSCKSLKGLIFEIIYSGLNKGEL